MRKKIESNKKTPTPEKIGVNIESCLEQMHTLDLYYCDKKSDFLETFESDADFLKNTPDQKQIIGRLVIVRDKIYKELVLRADGSEAFADGDEFKSSIDYTRNIDGSVRTLGPGGGEWLTNEGLRVKDNHKRAEVTTLIYKVLSDCETLLAQ